MRRTGIDLSPTRCVVIEAEPVKGQSPSGSTAARVHRYAILDRGELDALGSRLESLLAEGYPRRAWVNLWSLRSVHQYLLLPDTGVPDIQAAARRHAAAALGVDEIDVACALTLGAQRAEPGRAPKREVSVYAAPLRELEAALQLFAGAGFSIEGATTPCGALWAQARMLTASDGNVHAHVALGARQSAIGIFSGGGLLHAKDLDWGYEGTDDTAPAPDREEVARRLAIDLKYSFLYLKQYWEDDVSQVLLCGDMPDVRSLTAPLIERLNIEVDTLDTLDGLDITAVPEGFPDVAAMCRLASSIAVAPPPANLMPAPDHTRAKRRRIFAVGTAAALVASAFLYARADAMRSAAEAEAIELESQVTALAARNEPAVVPEAESPAVEQGRVAAEVLDLAALLPAPMRANALQITSDADGWLVRIEVEGDEGQATARSALEDFARRLAASQAFGGAPEVSWVPQLSGRRVEMTARMRNAP